MTEYLVRFTLSAPGGTGMQNKARCVAIEGKSVDNALGKLIAKYAAKGRNPQPYAIMIDGAWQTVEFGHGMRVETVSGFSMGGEGWVTCGPLKSEPRPMEIERPDWAR